MYTKYGYLYKIKNINKAFGEIKINNKFNSDIFKQSFCGFRILNDESIANLFLETLLLNGCEAAKRYVSKSFLDRIDLDEIRGFFMSTRYKNLINVEFNHSPKNCRTNSILVLKDDTKNSIIHLHFVHEPDSFGKWKIYAIDKE